MDFVFDINKIDTYLCYYGNNILDNLRYKYGDIVPINLEVFDFVSHEIEALARLVCKNLPEYMTLWINRNRVYAIFAISEHFATEFNELFPGSYMDWRDISKEMCRSRFETILNNLNSENKEAA